MIVPRGVVAPLALLVALATTTIGFYVGIGEAPAQFFGSDAVVVLGPVGELIPGRGEVDVRILGAIRALPEVRHASPEIYLLTAIDGNSALVRGVDFQDFLRIEDLGLTRGQWPAAADDALAGAGFARAFGVGPGDVVLVPSTFARVATPVRVAGVFEADGPVRDELLIGLEPARTLADIPDTAVHLVRIDTTDPQNLTDLVRSVRPTFTYWDVELTPTHLIAGMPATLRANLTNWGQESGVKVVQVREGDRVVAQRAYEVGPRETVQVAFEFPLAEAGLRNLTINPTFTVVVEEAPLSFTGLPSAAHLGDALTFGVRDRDNRSVPRIQVTLGGALEVTNATGQVSFLLDHAGPVTVVAYLDGEPAARAEIVVAPRGDPNTGPPPPPASGGAPEPIFAPVVREILPPREVVGTLRPYAFHVVVENRGTISGNASFTLVLDGQTVGTREIMMLGPRETRAVPIEVGPVAPGAHEIGVDGTKVTLSFKAYPGRNPYGEWLLEPFDQARQPALVVGGAPAPQSSASQYIEELLGNVSLAVLTLSVASGGLAATGAMAVLSRHLAERAPSIGTLKALGATNEWILGRAGAEAARLGALAAAIGIALGMLVARLIDLTGYVRAFGHAVYPHYSPYVVILIFLGSVWFVVLTARGIARGLLERSPDDLMRGRVLRPWQEALPELPDALRRGPWSPYAPTAVGVAGLIAAWAIVPSATFAASAGVFAAATSHLFATLLGPNRTALLASLALPVAGAALALVADERDALALAFGAIAWLLLARLAHGVAAVAAAALAVAAIVASPSVGAAAAASLVWFARDRRSALVATLPLAAFLLAPPPFVLSRFENRVALVLAVALLALLTRQPLANSRPSPLTQRGLRKLGLWMPLVAVLVVLLFGRALLPDAVLQVPWGWRILGAGLSGAAVGLLVIGSAVVYGSASAARAPVAGLILSAPLAALQAGPAGMFALAPAFAVVGAAALLALLPKRPWRLGTHAHDADDHAARGPS